MNHPRAQRRKRGFWLGGLLALILVGVILYFAVQGGSSRLDPGSIAEAAERTSAEPGGSIKAEITYDLGGDSKTVTETGVGVFDAHSGRARIELSAPGADGSPVKVVTVSDEKSTFVSSRVVLEELPSGKAWLGMEPLLGQDPTTALSAGGGAKGSLAMLQAVGGGVERVGEETIRGENTTRYKGTIDLSQAAKKFAARGDAGLARLYQQTASRLSGPIPVEVWIGVGGLVRRQQMIERVSTDGKPLEVHLGIELFDFASHPNIKLPPQNLVLDYTPVLRAELGMMDGTSVGPLRLPTGVTPLSVAAFRRQATAICRATRAKEKTLAGRGDRLSRKLGALGNRKATLSEVQPVILELGQWLEDVPYREISAEIGELATLAPPAKWAADFHRYLTLYAQEAEWVLAEARAFESGHGQALDTARHQTERLPLRRELGRIVTRLGIQECVGEVESGPSSDSA